MPRRAAAALLWAAAVAPQCAAIAAKRTLSAPSALTAAARDVVGGARDRDEDSEAAANRERLYEAYNSLHSLANAYRKPFEVPAVVVVGAQSAGKSALVEALMGFQFNEVGGAAPRVVLQPTISAAGLARE